MVVEIDGSILEGGGQILRLSIALSVLSQVPIRIHKIRANRTKGGLAAQHLTGIRLAREICQGKLDNDTLGSTDVTFIPCGIRSGKFVADTQTAGSVALLLQVALPCVLFGSEQTNLILKGGTNADLAPQIDYVVNILKPMLQKFGINFDVEIIKRGFFQGNGVISVTTDPVGKLSPINLVDFGEVDSIQGEAFVAGVLPLKMANEMAEAAEKLLRGSTKARISIKPIKFKNTEAFGNGSGINLKATTTTGCYLGSSNLGEVIYQTHHHGVILINIGGTGTFRNIWKRGINPEQVGFKAAELLLESINKKCCVDQKMQDQLILFMALADGKSRIKVGPITSHTETAIYITEMLTKAKFKITNSSDGTNIIECDGIGQKTIL